MVEVRHGWSARQQPGNFVSEFAHSQGTTAFNILLVVARGTQNMFRPFGSTPADLQKNWNATASPSDNGELNLAVAIALHAHRQPVGVTARQEKCSTRDLD